MPSPTATEIQVAILERELQFLSRQVGDLVVSIREVEQRSKTLEAYVTRWKGASGALLGVGALLAWLVDKAINFLPHH